MIIEIYIKNSIKTLYDLIPFKVKETLWNLPEIFFRVYWQILQTLKVESSLLCL